MDWCIGRRFVTNRMAAEDGNSLALLKEGDYVFIRTSCAPERYISARPDGHLEFVDKPGPDDKNCRLQLIRKGKLKWAFRSVHNQYMSAVAKDVVFGSETPLRREEFRLEGTLDATTFYSKFHAFFVLMSRKRTKLKCKGGRGGERDDSRERFFAIERLSA